MDRFPLMTPIKKNKLETYTYDWLTAVTDDVTDEADVPSVIWI